MSDQRGLTLIEGLAAIAVLVLIMALFTVALFGAREEARDVKRVSDIQSLRSSMAAVKVQFGAYTESGCQAGSVAECTDGNLAAVLPTVANFQDPRGEELCTVDCGSPCQYAFGELAEDDYQVLFYLEKGVGEYAQQGCYSLSHQGIEFLR